MKIRQLPETLVNQIAAGEVIERPAAAIKELVENALDAGATQIKIEVKDGGRTYICVDDNGFGMSRDELCLALERHATSKLPDDDLLRIAFLGFRGEALPSIASVCRLKIASFSQDQQEAWEISAEGGRKTDPIPSSHPQGTKIEISDLFYATPARLKFLKSDRSENSAIKDMVVRLAMTAPQTGFILNIENKKMLHLTPSSLEERVGRLLGRDFPENAMPIDGERDGIHIHGLASLPTFNKGNSLQQYLFVNGRAVRDRLLLGALKGAYGDVLSRDRYPVVALFITLACEEVDVNVHPAKAEVRFRDAALVRGLLVSALRYALHEHAGQTSSHLSETALSHVTQHNPLPLSRGGQAAVPASYIRARGGLAEKVQSLYEPLFAPEPSARYEPQPEEITQIAAAEQFPLGAARAQIHENYIIAQSDQGLVIIDQHAAHERLVYEKLKAQKSTSGITRQGLLTPEIIELDDLRAANLVSFREDLIEYGLEIDAFGSGAVAVSAMPALLGEKADIGRLLHDLSDELEEHETVQHLEEQILAVLSRRACHGSIRSGRRMNAAEMNHLLREMESTPLAGQCNHGRPTYVKLSLADIEKLFKRR